MEDYNNQQNNLKTQAPCNWSVGKETGGWVEGAHHGNANFHSGLKNPPCNVYVWKNCSPTWRTRLWQGSGQGSGCRAMDFGLQRLQLKSEATHERREFLATLTPMGSSKFRVAKKRRRELVLEGGQPTLQKSTPERGTAVVVRERKQSRGKRECGSLGCRLGYLVLLRCLTSWLSMDELLTVATDQSHSTGNQIDPQKLRNLCRRGPRLER